MRIGADRARKAKVDWNGPEGAEYRRNFKKENYEGITIQFKKNAEDGLTREAAQAQAAARGMDLSNYIKSLIKADMERND